MEKGTKKLVLGTVEFGMEYGLDRARPQPRTDEVFAILDEAYAAGVKVLDTASAYGTAEEVLGEWIAARGLAGRIRVISKLKFHAADERTGYWAAEAVRDEIQKSLARLRIGQLDGYLLHAPAYVYRNDVIAALRQAKKEGLVANIGVSVYDEPEAFEAFARGLDYVQIPYNALDQRFSSAEFWDGAAAQGAKVFARSPFLQGLLLLGPEEIPQHLMRARPLVEAFARIAREYALSQPAAALLFALNGCPAEGVVFGVKTLAHMRDTIAAARQPVPAGFIDTIKAQFKNIDGAIANPSLWNSLKQ